MTDVDGLMKVLICGWTVIELIEGVELKVWVVTVGKYVAVLTHRSL
jgi:hypothetical protein